MYVVAMKNGTMLELKRTVISQIEGSQLPQKNRLFILPNSPRVQYIQWHLVCVNFDKLFLLRLRRKLDVSHYFYFFTPFFKISLLPFAWTEKELANPSWMNTVNDMLSICSPEAWWSSFWGDACSFTITTFSTFLLLFSSFPEISGI